MCTAPGDTWKRRACRCVGTRNTRSKGSIGSSPKTRMGTGWRFRAQRFKQPRSDSPFVLLTIALIFFFDGFARLLRFALDDESPRRQVACPLAQRRKQDQREGKPNEIDDAQHISQDARSDRRGLAVEAHYIQPR